VLELRLGAHLDKFLKELSIPTTAMCAIWRKIIEPTEDNIAMSHMVMWGGCHLLFIGV